MSNHSQGHSSRQYLDTKWVNWHAKNIASSPQPTTRARLTLAWIYPCSRSTVDEGCIAESHRCLTDAARVLLREWDDYVDKIVYRHMQPMFQQRIISACRDAPELVFAKRPRLSWDTDPGPWFFSVVLDRDRDRLIHKDERMDKEHWRAVAAD